MGVMRLMGEAHRLAGGKGILLLLSVLLSNQSWVETISWGRKVLSLYIHTHTHEIY